MATIRWNISSLLRTSASSSKLGYIPSSSSSDSLLTIATRAVIKGSVERISSILTRSRPCARKRTSPSSFLKRRIWTRLPMGLRSALVMFGIWSYVMSGFGRKMQSPRSLRVVASKAAVGISPESATWCGGNGGTGGIEGKTTRSSRGSTGNSRFGFFSGARGSRCCSFCECSLSCVSMFSSWCKAFGQLPLCK